MLSYVNEIRVTVELILTLAALWWAIRIFATASTEKDRLHREEDQAADQVESTQRSTRKIEEACAKIRERIVPQQMAVVQQLQQQIYHLEREMEATKLPAKVRMYQEVQQFYSENPESRYFRASDWAPVD